MPALALLPLIAASWLAGPGAPAAVPSVVLEAAQLAADQAASAVDDLAVPVNLYDENHPKETRTVWIGRDGSVDDATAATLEHMFRCKRTERHKPVDRGLLAMVADVAAHYPGHTIEYVSAYRAKDEPTSRHRQARAFDFRVVGVPSTEVRDYVWTRHQNIGVGWYPESNFVHIDHRPGDKDYAWTQIGGREHRNPIWSIKARRGDAPVERTDRVGL